MTKIQKYINNKQAINIQLFNAVIYHHVHWMPAPCFNFLIPSLFTLITYG